MKFSKSKTTTTAIALFLMFAMAVSLFALPAANAQPELKTYPVIGATPNPVGVGQETLILLGITQQLESALYAWEGLTVTVTKPDGTTETLGPFDTDATGMTGTVYVPTAAGNYTLQVHFPEQVCEEGVIGFMGGGIAPGTVMLASDSIKITLVVQEEPITYYPGLPLPTEYWTRPIDQQLREWAPIAGNWLMTPRNRYAIGNDDAPETAHILWTTPLTSGGLVGGTVNPYGATEEDVIDIGYETGDAYEGKWGAGFFGGGQSIIMGGKLYYQKYAGNDKYKETICVDLHTGEQLWSRVFLNNLTLTRGQLHFWQTYDNQGVYDYLWCTVGGTMFDPSPATWHAFDPFTGDWVYTLYGLPSGTFDYGPKGEMMIYTVDQTNGWMTIWNSTNIPWLYADRDYASMSWGQWQPMGKTINATGYANVTIGGGLFGSMFGTPYIAPTTPLGLNGYQCNVTIQKGLQGSVQAAFTQDKIVGALINQTHVIAWALSLEPGKEGQLLYNEVWNAPSEWLDGNVGVSFGTISNIDDVFTVNGKENRLRYGFSTETGKYLWTISEPMAMLGHLSGGFWGEEGLIAYGNLYLGTVSGVIQAFDVETGELVWTYEARDPYMQVLWSNNFPMGYLFIADGKLYLGQMEHSANQPLPRGGPFICLNATTGEVIFRANGLFRQTVWGGPAIIGDSIIATMDTYDQRVYGIGKGPSATTVSASPKVSVHGSSVLVEGMVTDISPGTEEYGLTARFPHGVPAVADENISDWMLYVYKQFPRPADVVGVEVVLEVLDPNTNYYEVGRTTTNADGFFKLMFEPEVPGEYTIFATFEGSGAYYGSYAETAIGVEEAPAATPEPTPVPQAPVETYFTVSTIAIIIAIAVAVVLLLRKR
jgi:outer membrane protein assembly factor BamB